jgi:uncharacterized phiE125 gp8 family phage protein
MAVFRIAEPNVEPVGVDEARAWLRIVHGSEDGLLADLIRAARNEVEQQTGMSLINQQWRMTLDRWPDDGLVVLPKGPVSEVLSIITYGAGGDPATVPSADYQLDGMGDPPRIAMLRRLESGRAINGIEIDYEAGHGASSRDVPAALKRAILLLVAHWFDMRGAIPAADQPASHPDGFMALVRAFRRVRL